MFVQISSNCIQNHFNAGKSAGWYSEACLPHQVTLLKHNQMNGSFLVTNTETRIWTFVMDEGMKNTPQNVYEESKCTDEAGLNLCRCFCLESFPANCWLFHCDRNVFTRAFNVSQQIFRQYSHRLITTLEMWQLQPPISSPNLI